MRNFNVIVQLGKRVLEFQLPGTDVATLVDAMWETYPSADLIQIDPL